MPKITRERKRLHHKAVDFRPAEPTNASSPPSNAFAGETFVVNRTVATAPVLTATDLASEEDQSLLKKKEKRQLRHDRWMQKLETMYTPKCGKSKKKNVGALSLDSIFETLPSPETEKKTKTPIHFDQRPKAISQSARRKAGVQEILRLQKVITHPTFRSNPLGTIRQHLENSRAKNSQ
ncbi:ribosome biogenesis protein SLX9-domain-containing protein [Phlyctochytrium arcticum]|nr:ribosome biogenesis protein SLX9-domain-containing protein [Phlyctochytrium arcticum]